MAFRTGAAALAAFLFAAGLAHAAEPMPVARREVGAQILENIPEASPALRDTLLRYESARAAEFEGWLGDGSALIATRFGETWQLHRVARPLGARTQLTFYDDEINGAQTVPGGDRYIFAKDHGGDEWFQLWLQAPGAPPVQLTEPGTRNSAFAISPDGKTVLFSRGRKGSGDYDILAVDLASPEAPRLVLKGEGAVAPLDVSADGNRALIERFISVSESRRWILDLATGALAVVGQPHGVNYGGGRFTPDGKVVMTSDEGADVSRLVEIDPATGRSRLLSAPVPWEVETFDLSRDGKTIAYAINEEGASRVVLLDCVTGKRLPTPDLPPGIVDHLSFSPDGVRLGFDMVSATTSLDVWSWSLKDKTLTRWTASELGGLDEAALVAPELLRFKSFDGRSIPAWVYRPRGAKGPTPVVISIHGGPEGQSRPRLSLSTQELVNELGVTVIVPNVRGSTGYGRTYANLDNAEKREDSVKDIGALLDWIGTRPDLDAKRVAVWGGSYGGYMSLASMTFYSDRLAGGIEEYGISNFISFLQNTEAYRRDLRRAEYGDERDPEMRKVFERISPLNNVGRITKPMLVMQGVNDPRVPKSESDQVVAKLRGQGLEVWYAVFKDEGHGFVKKVNTDREREAITLFLQKIFGLTPPAG